MRCLLPFTFCCLLIFNLPGQDFPYALDWQQEWKYLAFGAVASGTGHLIEAGMPGLTPEEAAALNAADIWSFDRSATTRLSSSAIDWSNRLLQGSFLVPAPLLLNRPLRSNLGTVGIMALETGLLTEGFTKLTKVIIRRPRPLLYNPASSPVEFTRNNNRQSFFSGHTSVTAAICFFSAKVFHDLHPNSSWRPVVWGAAAIVPALTGYARYEGGKHFPTDILVGYGVGMAIGILIPQCHLIETKRNTGLQLGPGAAGGLGLVWRL